MTQEYLRIYQQQGAIIDDAFKELNVYLNGYRSLKNSGNSSEDNLNLFRLAYCAWFYSMENCIILREHIRASDSTVEMERLYSIRRMLVSIYEMSKHLFGVEEKLERRALWSVMKPILQQTDAYECAVIDGEIKVFKDGFVNFDTKNSRCLFEHYAEIPKDLEMEMKRLTAEAGDVHMLRFLNIICKIAKLASKCIANDMELTQYVDLYIEVNNEPEMQPSDSLTNLQRILMMHSVKQVGYNSIFDSFYTQVEKVSKIATGQSSNVARLLKDFNDLHFLCTQIQRDISYAMLSITASESRIEQLMNVRYVFRHVHEGFKRIYGYTQDSQESTSYWARCIKPYICGIADEQIIEQYHEIETLLKKYSEEDVNDEGKRAVLTHIRVKPKKQDDYIPDLMDWCQSTTLISELGILTDFQKTIMKVSDFTRGFSKEVMKTVRG